jgi:hypothetical protein
MISPFLPALRMAEDVCLTLLLHLFSFKGLLVPASPTTYSATRDSKPLSKPSSIPLKKGTSFPILIETPVTSKLSFLKILKMLVINSLLLSSYLPQ